MMVVIEIIKLEGNGKKNWPDHTEGISYVYVVNQILSLFLTYLQNKYEEG